MSTRNYDKWAFRKAWIRYHKAEITAVLAVVIACALFGAWLLNPPQKLGYERGTVNYVGVREGSKAPGVRMQVETRDGRMIWINSQAYNPDLSEGAEICLLKTRGQWRGGTFYQLALPKRCLETEAALAKAGPGG